MPGTAESTSSPSNLASVRTVIWSHWPLASRSFGVTGTASTLILEPQSSAIDLHLAGGRSLRIEGTTLSETELVTIGHGFGLINSQPNSRVP